MPDTLGPIYTPNPDERKHKCEICGKAFDAANILTYHKSIEHSSE